MVFGRVITFLALSGGGISRTSKNTGDRLHYHAAKPGNGNGEKGVDGEVLGAVLFNAPDDATIGVASGM